MKIWITKNGRNLIPIIISIVILIGIVYFFGIRPNQQLNEVKQSLQAKDFIELKNGVRTGLAQALGGAILLIGLFFTWRNIKATEKNLVIAQENMSATQESSAKNLAIALEGQITERFTKAIELLGSGESIAARLGGIYALERIAKDSEKDHWTIMEVLTSYIREVAPSNRGGVDVPGSVEEALRTINKPLTDVQACLDVISRRKSECESKKQQLNLIAVDLRRCSLIGAHLENAQIAHSRFDWAALNGAHLEGALLYGTHFERAFLQEAHFDGAELTKCNFESAWLIDTHFNNCKLADANFDKSVFRRTHFEGANLSTVKGITQEQIDRAVIDENTILPKGIVMSQTSEGSGEA